jgi:hypothetical protein
MTNDKRNIENENASKSLPDCLKQIAEYTLQGESVGKADQRAGQRRLHPLPLDQSEIFPPVKLSTAPVIPLDWSEDAKTSAFASSASVVDLFV